MMLVENLKSIAKQCLAGITHEGTVHAVLGHKLINSDARSTSLYYSFEFSSFGNIQ